MDFKIVKYFRFVKTQNLLKRKSAAGVPVGGILMNGRGYKCVANLVLKEMISGFTPPLWIKIVCSRIKNRQLLPKKHITFCFKVKNYNLLLWLVMSTVNYQIVMKQIIKERYETPSLQVVALKMEGIICESVMGANVSDLNDFIPDPTNPFGGISLSSTNPFASSNPFGFPTF